MNKMYRKWTDTGIVITVITDEAGTIIDNQAYLPMGDLRYEREYWDYSMIGQNIAEYVGFKLVVGGYAHLQKRNPFLP